MIGAILLQILIKDYIIVGNAPIPIVINVILFHKNKKNAFRSFQKYNKLAFKSWS